MKIAEIFSRFLEKFYSLDSDFKSSSKLLSKIWSLPVLGLWFYVVTVLTQHGYNRYFNVPSDFIEASIQSNIVSSFDFARLFQKMLSSVSWWSWLKFFVPIGIVGLLYYRSYIYRSAITFVEIGLLVFLALKSYSFGFWLAQNNETFYVPSSSCTTIGSDEKYIAPVFYSGSVVFVPYNKDTHKINGGFIVKDVSQLGCALELSSVGKLVK